MNNYQTKAIADGWKIALPGADENEQLAELRELNILDTEAEESFDTVTNLTA